MTDMANEWAWTRVEAMADGSLSAGEARRMREAVRRDPRLATAVAQAAALREAVKGLGGVPVPRSLLPRLWRLPATVPAGLGRSPVRPPSAGRMVLRWASAASAAAIVVAGAWLMRGPQPQEEDPRAAALRESEIAMAYVQRSAVSAGEEVRRALGRGFRAAVETSRDAVAGEDHREKNGG